MNELKKDAFAVAKEALQLVGRFGTPPTPDVFEVWFRFVEGADELLLNQMHHAVHEAESVSVEMLNSIHEQFCTKADDTQCNVGEALSSELDKFQSFISRQEAAGTELGSKTAILIVGRTQLTQAFVRWSPVNTSETDGF